MKVLIIDEQRMYADGIQKLLVGYNQKFITEYAADIYQAYEKIINSDYPDLIILGVNDTSSTNNYDFIKMISKFDYQIPVIISSANNSSLSVAKAIENNASGFITKYFSLENTLKAVLSVINGDMYFSMPKKQITTETEAVIGITVTSRQQEILILLSHGLLNKQIASELDISANTVKAHIHDIFRKLQVTNRTAAVVNSQKHGII